MSAPEALSYKKCIFSDARDQNNLKRKVYKNNIELINPKRTKCIAKQNITTVAITVNVSFFKAKRCLVVYMILDIYNHII